MSTSTIKRMPTFDYFDFNGTVDADKEILTGVPLSTHIPIATCNLSRHGWRYEFVQNGQKNSTYWYVHIQNADTSAYSGRILAYVK